VAYFSGEVFRLARQNYAAKALLFTAIAAIIVFFFRLYAPEFRLYSEASGFMLFAFTARAILFFASLLLVFFLQGQYQQEIENGLVRHVLSTSLTRNCYVRQRWAAQSLIWMTGLFALLLLFALLSAILLGFTAVSEGEYIFYSLAHMLASLLAGFFAYAIIILLQAGLINSLLLRLGNSGFIIAVILIVGTFFAPVNDYTAYLYPGIHSQIFIDSFAQMTYQLPVTAADIWLPFAVNSVLWLAIVYIVQLTAMRGKDV
jgi:hypothetical protein